MRKLMLRLAGLLAVATEGMTMPLDRCAFDSKVSVVAHRGRMGPGVTENSLRQIQRTFAAGHHILEIDIRSDRDGELYLLHDTTLNRTTDGVGALADTATIQVSRLHLRDGLGATTDEPIPTFKALARWASTTNHAQLLLDIKATPPAIVATIVREAHLIDRAVVLTFDLPTAKAALAADKDWLVSVLAKSPQEIIDYQALFKDRRFAIYVPTDADPSLFRLARNTGRLVVTDAVVSAAGASLDQRAVEGGAQIYSDYLGVRPVDLFVTDFAPVVCRTLNPTQPPFVTRGR